jgi:hypothetical protein
MGQEIQVLNTKDLGNRFKSSAGDDSSRGLSSIEEIHHLRSRLS